MTTLHLKIKDTETLKHLMWFLEKFDQNELQVVHSEQEFDFVREELQNELEAIDKGQSELIDIEDLDKELEKIIFRYEN